MPTEDVYSAVEQDGKSKMGANNESNEGSDMFNSDGKRNSEWSYGKPINATDNIH